MSERDDMKLPEGMTCADCFSFARCRSFLGPATVNDKQTRCDWSPSRFRFQPTVVGNLKRDRDELVQSLEQMTAWARQLGVSGGRALVLGEHIKTADTLIAKHAKPHGQR